MAKMCSVWQSSAGAISAGIVALPRGAQYPGIKPEVATTGGKRPVYFATAGERGVIRVSTSFRLSMLNFKRMR